MTDINVDDFFNDAARALITLYQIFPRRRAVFVEDISGPEEPDEFGMFSDRYLACYSTLLWLGEEGYLRYEESINQEAIDQAVLTARCFTLLSNPTREFAVRKPNIPRSVIEEQSSLVFQLQTAVRQRSSTEVRTIMQRLMTGMAGLAWPGAANRDNETG